MPLRTILVCIIARFTSDLPLGHGIIRSTFHFVAQDGEKANGLQYPNFAYLPVKFGLPEDCLQNPSCCRRRHDFVTDAFNFEFWPGKASELSPDTDFDWSIVHAKFCPFSCCRGDIFLPDRVFRTQRA